MPEEPRETPKKIVRRKKKVPKANNAFARQPSPPPPFLSNVPPPPPPPPLREMPTVEIIPPLSPPPVPIIVDPARRERTLQKIAASAGLVVDRDVFLQSIRTGIKLRKVPVIDDRSGLILEGSDVSRSRPESLCSLLSLDGGSSASGYWSETDTASTSRSLPRLPPPPIAPAPRAPSPTSSEGNQPIVGDPAKRAAILQKLAAQAANPVKIDRDALLRSIHVGVQLRKTDIKDRSGLVVDDTMIKELQSRPETPVSIASSSDAWRPKSPAVTPPPLIVSSAPVPPPIVADPARRAAILKKMAAHASSPAKVDRGALLRSIQQGVQLRKTVINDCSKPLADADIELRPATPCSISSLDSQGMSSPYTSIGSSSCASSSCDFTSFSKSITPLAAAPPSPLNPPPPPALASDAPIVHDPRKRELILNKLAMLANSGQHVDRDALLRSIRGGVKLRGVKTNDRSEPILDSQDTKRPDTAASSSGCETDYSPRSSINTTATPTPYRIVIHNENDESSSSFASSRRVSSSTTAGDKESAASSRSVSRNSSINSKTSEVDRPIEKSNIKKGTTSSLSIKAKNSAEKSILIETPAPISEEKKKSDFYFDENNLKVTKEDLENEIPVGSAKAKIAALKCFETVNDAITKSKSISPVPRRSETSAKLKDLTKQFEANESNQQNGLNESNRSRLSTSMTNMKNNEKTENFSTSEYTPTPPSSNPPPLKITKNKIILTPEASKSLLTDNQNNDKLATKSNFEKLRHSFGEKLDENDKIESNKNLDNKIKLNKKIFTANEIANEQALSTSKNSKQNTWKNRKYMEK